MGEIVDLRDLEAKFSAFGWYVTRCNGHDFGEIGRAFSACDNVTKQPRVIIADTIKGKGIKEFENDPVWHARQLKGHEIEIGKKRLGIK